MTTVNLDTHTAVKDGVPIIANGKAVPPYEIANDRITFDKLGRLYKTYKYSVPDSRDRTRSYFKALPGQELTVSQITKGTPRAKAREKLELSLLEGILNGSLEWPDDRKWFIQPSADRDFVLLKRWFKTEKEI